MSHLLFELSTEQMVQTERDSGMGGNENENETGNARDYFGWYYYKGVNKCG